MREAGLFGMMISVHSTDRAAHDEFSGVEGAFGTAVRALRLCRQHGLATTVNSVLSEKEVVDGGLGELMDLARNLDCDYVQLIHPKPAGTWLNRHDGMQTDRGVIQHLQREHLRYNSSRMRDYPSLAAQVFEESEAVLGCTAGAVDRFYINAHGEVQPCEFLNISFGNVNEEEFDAILARMRSHFRIPCRDWLCCTQADGIGRLFSKHGAKRTPLPWEVARDLVEGWDRGEPTPVYEKLGVYR
jgi:MoaA/NifB/PqqE/SkfB family radical SAM enzyme